MALITAPGATVTIAVQALASVTMHTRLNSAALGIKTVVTRALGITAPVLEERELGNTAPPKYVRTRDQLDGSSTRERENVCQIPSEVQVSPQTDQQVRTYLPNSQILQWLSILARQANRALLLQTTIIRMLFQMHTHSYHSYYTLLIPVAGIVREPAICEHYQLNTPLHP